jgi:hypothetical protein
MTDGAAGTRHLPERQHAQAAAPQAMISTIISMSTAAHSHAMSHAELQAPGHSVSMDVVESVHLAGVVRNYGLHAQAHKPCQPTCTQQWLMLRERSSLRSLDPNPSFKATRVPQQQQDLTQCVHFTMHWLLVYKLLSSLMVCNRSPIFTSLSSRGLQLTLSYAPDKSMKAAANILLALALLASCK